MTDIQQIIHAKAESCPCGKIHQVSLKHYRVGKGALEALAGILKTEGLDRSVHLAADENTWAVSGQEVFRLLGAAGLSVTRTIFAGKPDLVADEAAVDRLTREMPAGTSCLVAVGTGTLNDLGRWVSFQAKIPYIIVATAPSMDGFASTVSPLIIRGFKNTYTAHAPLAILADLDALCASPPDMVAAGFGDLAGKLVSLSDWKLGALLTGEDFCQATADLVRQATELALAQVDGLVRRDPAAVAALMDGLVLSGLGMMWAGSSRPASGCEHHLSHFWEMRYLQEGRPALLHGRKVAVATVLMAAVSEKLAALGPQGLREKAGRLAQASLVPGEELLSRSFRNLASEVRSENGDGAGIAVNPETLVKTADEVWKLFNEIPKPEAVAGMLRALGAPATPQELGVGDDLAREGLLACLWVRKRYTRLRLAEALGILDPVVDQVMAGSC